MQRQVVGALIVVAAAAAGVFGGSRISLTAEITHFLPDAAEDRERATLSALLSDSELSRTWIVTIGADDRDLAAQAGGIVSERLRRRPEVARLRSGAEPELREAVYDLYFPRRMYFADPSQLDDAGLNEAATRLRRELGMPTSALVRGMAPEDPLLLFLDRMEALDEARAGNVQLHQGQLVSDDGYAVILMTTQHSAFDNDRNRSLANAIDEAVEDAQTELGESLELEQSSVHRFSIASERAIKDDVTRISIVSTLGILVLFLGLFRSPRTVLLTFLPVAVGVAFALAAVALAFDRVHGLTLAFGASLIGVCVDYSVHLSTHHCLAAGEQDRDVSLRRVWPGILLGGLTTIAGLAGLAWTSFPGIREVAVFASVGVAGALLATRYVVAPWLVRRPRPIRFHTRLATALSRLYERTAERPWTVVALAGLLLAVGAVGLPQLEWADSLSALNELDPDLVAEDERVRARVSRVDAGRFVVSLGASQEDALRGNDAVSERLKAAMAAGELDTFRSLSAFVRSEEHQRQSLEALRGPELPARLERVYTAAGFSENAFGPFFEELEGPAPPLTIDALRDSALGDAVAPFVIDDVAGQTAVLAFLRGVDRPDALASRLDDVSGAFYFDQHDFLTDAYGAYRERTLELVFVGLLAVLLLVFARYRKLSLALAAFLPALVAALTTLGLLGLLGLRANLMHLMALLLVLSIGVDYGVFVIEHRRGGPELAATLSSLVIACLTTCLSFGLLAMSSNPALRALGVAVSIGVLLALLLAPAGLVLARKATTP